MLLQGFAFRAWDTRSNFCLSILTTNGNSNSICNQAHVLVVAQSFTVPKHQGCFASWQKVSRWTATHPSWSTAQQVVLVFIVAITWQPRSPSQALQVKVGGTVRLEICEFCWVVNLRAMRNCRTLMCIVYGMNKRSWFVTSFYYHTTFRLLRDVMLNRRWISLLLTSELVCLIECSELDVPAAPQYPKVDSFDTTGAGENHVLAPIFGGRNVCGRNSWHSEGIRNVAFVWWPVVSS